MDEHSQVSQRTEADTSREKNLRNVLNSYGVILFLGLLISIFAHEIEYISEFLFFIIISSVLYFLLLNLYFRNSLWRKVVLVTVFVIAVFSLFMVFYLQINPVYY